MENTRQSNRRRNHPRYQALDRALAMVSSAPTGMPYHIIDISKGGLAFRYLGEKMQGEQITQLDLYYNDDLCISNIPVTSVGDCWTGSDLTDIRRNCLAFTGLSGEQQEQLDLYIKQYTVSPTH